MTGPPADTPGGAEAALLRGTSEARKKSAFELKGPGKGGVLGLGFREFRGLGSGV